LAYARLSAIAALYHRNYRLYWIGVVVSVIGYQLQFIGVGWLVYRMTGSPFYLGLVGLFTAVPTIALSLIGGVIADRVSRLHLLMITQSIAAVSSFVLASLTITGAVQIWHILLLASVNGTFAAFDTPARQAMLPDLVEREDLMNAVALASAAWQVARVVGPAIAGILIAGFGEAVCFYATSIGYGVMLLMILQLKIQIQAAIKHENMWRNLVSGLSFVAKSPLFAIIIGLTFMNSLFGISYITLMPAFARDILHAGAKGYGLLLTAGGIGAIMGSVLIASWGKRARRGFLMMGGSSLFGVLLIAFSLSRNFNAALALVMIAGTANAIYMVVAQTVLQAEVPDELRGRVMGLYGLTWSLIPLGGMLSGTIAALVGSPFAVGLGGFFVMCFTLCVVLAFPHIRRLV
jgi:MFS family permease